MSSAVLNRDLTAYQDAYDQYVRQARSYNSQANAYNASFYHDANGDLAGAAGNSWSKNVPFSMAGYGLWSDPGAPGNQLLRRPDSVVDAGTAKVGGYGRGGLFVTLPDGRQYSLNGEHGKSGRDLAMAGYIVPDVSGVQQGQTITLQRGVYSDTPVAPEFNAKAPSMTITQAKNLATPTMAQQEAGLIGSVLQSAGVR